MHDQLRRLRLLLICGYFDSAQFNDGDNASTAAAPAARTSAVIVESRPPLAAAVSSAAPAGADIARAATVRRLIKNSTPAPLAAPNLGVVPVSPHQD